MLKFRYLIHKETGKVIKYEEWKEKFDNNTAFHWKDEEDNGIWQYWAKDILFLGDFEIIYESEFTTEELESIREHIKDENKDLKAKVSELIGEREYIKNKYGIEV